MPNYHGMNWREEIRKGDTVTWRWYDTDYEGVVVRFAKDGSWADVRRYTGPGSIFPEIDHRTRRIPVFKLHFVRHSEQHETTTKGDA